MSPPYDDLAEFQEPARETVAYRIGSEVHRHTTRLELLEERLTRALAEHETMNREREQLSNRFQAHEEEQHHAQHRLMLVIILTLLSATGGLIVLTVQSLVTIAK
ncbi:MAG: hypothetical protein IT487_20100 [Chromatiaceae bacterium]|nr:hypothetical protein [Chromatiaceae bacterium]